MNILLEVKRMDLIELLNPKGIIPDINSNWHETRTRTCNSI